MKNLGVEFYRNYVGIEKPLRVICLGNERSLFSVNKTEIESNTNFFYKFSEVKPLIKSPKDLTDEEWLWIFCGDKKIKDMVISRDKDEDSIYLLFSDGLQLHHQNVFFFCGHFEYCDQQILNRLYSLHVALNAEELFDKDLAVRAK